MYPYAYHSIIQGSQVMEATRVPFDQQLDKLWYVYTMEYY